MVGPIDEVQKLQISDQRWWLSLAEHGENYAPAQPAIHETECVLLTLTKSSRREQVWSIDEEGRENEAFLRITPVTAKMAQSSAQRGSGTIGPMRKVQLPLRLWRNKLKESLL